MCNSASGSEDTAEARFLLDLDRTLNIVICEDTFQLSTRTQISTEKKTKPELKNTNSFQKHQKEMDKATEIKCRTVGVFNPTFQFSV